jgi:hypothetical protein
MADPFATTIAASVAAKVADTLSDQAQAAVAAIIRKIRERLRSRPDEVAVLDAAITRSDASAAEALAGVLEQLFAADPGLREQVRALWDSAAGNGGVTNVFYGKADKVIMMRDVNGDLTIN